MEVITKVISRHILGFNGDVTVVLFGFPPNLSVWQEISSRSCKHVVYVCSTYHARFYLSTPAGSGHRAHITSTVMEVTDVI